MCNIPRFAFALAVTGLVPLAPLSASALIMTGSGNQAVHDAGWPEGALAVANLESRIGWWEGPPFGGGEWHFLYQGNTEAFQEALAAFAAIRAPTLDLVVHDGPQEDGILKKEADWTFTVWVPANWHRLFNNPKSVFEADHPNFRQPVAPPRLEVYVGKGVDWAKVKVPPGLSVRDERATARTNAAGGAGLRADLYDMATGKPIAGAQVTVERIFDTVRGRPSAPEKAAEATSDATGRVEITKLPPGTYRLTVGADGYAPRALSYERYGERTFKQFAIELARTAAICGTVTDDNGKPIEGVKVSPSNVMAINGRGYTLPQLAEAVTDKDGAFALTDLPAGFTQFRIHHPVYYFSDLFTIHEVPGPNVVLRMIGAGSIHVSVTDNEGHALSRYEGNEILVEVEPKGGSRVGSRVGSAKVKDDGTFEFDKVPPGEYRIKSRPNPSNSNRQYAPEQIVTVAPGAPTKVKVIYE